VIPVAQPATSEWARERRRAPRFPITVPVKVVYGSEAGGAQFGFTADFSSHGALLLLPQQIDPGTDLEFRVSIPRDLQNIRSPFIDVIVHGRVARLVSRDQRNGIAVDILAVDRVAEA